MLKLAQYVPDLEHGLCGPQTSPQHKETHSLVGPGSASHCLHAGTTVPDADGSSLHLGL